MSGYLGSLKADPRSKRLDSLNQTSVIRLIARARPTLEGGTVDHRNQDFLKPYKGK